MLQSPVDFDKCVSSHPHPLNSFTVLEILCFTYSTLPPFPWAPGTNYFFSLTFLILYWSIVNNAVIVSGVQQNDSVIYKNVLFFFKFFSYLGCYITLSRIPYFIQCVCRLSILLIVSDGDHFLKSLLNSSQYCFCSMFWFFGHGACGILAARTGVKPAPPALGGKVFTTGPPGKSLVIHFKHRGEYMSIPHSLPFPPPPHVFPSLERLIIRIIK